VYFTKPPESTDIKQQLHIHNAQLAVLEASEDFMKTASILVSGLVTDMTGSASQPLLAPSCESMLTVQFTGAILWGNAIYSMETILIAAATTIRSYKFMIFEAIVQAFGAIATQVAQYKIFASWFAPPSGFASTLGFELGIGKIGSFVGKAIANVIAKNMGDFSWVYWIAVL
jgi:hypothetical protein